MTQIKSNEKSLLLNYLDKKGLWLRFSIILDFEIYGINHFIHFYHKNIKIKKIPTPAGFEPTRVAPWDF